MVLEKPPAKKLAKIETLKVQSLGLLQPLKDVRVCGVVVVWYDFPGGNQKTFTT